MHKERQRVGRSDILYWLGCVSVWRWLTRREIKFVTVHGVIDNSEKMWSPLRWQLEKQTLREYLNVLVDQYEFVEPNEALAMLEGTIPTRSNCALFTIDDGYRNALTNAIPVLREFNIKPLIFVATGMVGNDSLFWFDRLDVAIQSTQKAVKSVSLGHETVFIDSNSTDGLRDTCKRIIYKSRDNFDDEEERLQAINTLIENLYAAAEMNESFTDDIFERVGLLTSNQLLQCVAEGAVIGSHTVTHVRLPYVKADRIDAELRKSKADLEKWLDAECAIFCYPEGSTNEEVTSQVRKAGYRVAFAVSRDGNIFNRNILALHRTHLPQKASKSELLCSASGLTDTLYNLKQQVISSFSSHPREESQ